MSNSSDYFIGGTRVNNAMIEEFWIPPTQPPASHRVRGGISDRYLQTDNQSRENQLHGALHSSNFHFPSSFVAGNGGSFLVNGSNLLSNRVCRPGFAPMSRNLLARAQQGEYDLQYNVNTRRVRWLHIQGNNTSHNVNQSVDCVIIVACGAGGSGGNSTSGFGNRCGGGGGGGGVSVTQINLREIAMTNPDVGSGWRNCLRVNAGGASTYSAVRIFENSSLRQVMRGNGGGNGSTTHDGAGGGFSTITVNNRVRAAAHTTAAGQSSPSGGRNGANAGNGGDNNGRPFTNNIFTSFATENMGLINQSAVYSSYGHGGARGGSSSNSSSGGGGGFYGNGGAGGSSGNSGRGGSGFGAGGGGAGGTTFWASSGGAGSPGIIAIYW